MMQNNFNNNAKFSDEMKRIFEKNIFLYLKYIYFNLQNILYNTDRINIYRLLILIVIFKFRVYFQYVLILHFPGLT